MFEMLFEAHLTHEIFLKFVPEMRSAPLPPILLPSKSLNNRATPKLLGSMDNAVVRHKSINLLHSKIILTSLDVPLRG